MITIKYACEEDPPFTRFHLAWPAQLLTGLLNLDQPQTKIHKTNLLPIDTNAAFSIEVQVLWPIPVDYAWDCPFNNSLRQAARVNIQE